MENIRKHKDLKLVTKWGVQYGARVYISQPNFLSFTILGDDIILIEMSIKNVILNKPIYVSFSVLDLSKQKFGNFHYNFMKKKNFK